VTAAFCRLPRVAALLGESLLSETVVPDSGSADQVCVFAEGGERELALFCWNKAAAAADHFADAIEKEFRTLHDAPAQHDSVRSKEVDEIGES